MRTIEKILHQELRAGQRILKDAKRFEELTEKRKERLAFLNEGYKFLSQAQMEWAGNFYISDAKRKMENK